MVMNYPWVPIAGAAVLVVGFILIRFFPFGKGTPFHGGIRAANTYLTKELPYYRKLVFRKKVLTVILFASLTVSVMAASFLAARPYRVQKVTNGALGDPTEACVETADVIVAAVRKNFRKFLDQYYHFKKEE